jgi:MOSC domain-containing protein YiiM
MPERVSDQIGRVVSLHLHPEKGGDPLSSVDAFELAAEKGIVGNPRYFDRRNREGKPSRRQVTLIEREILRQHAAALSVDDFSPGVVRSNIETNGVDLIACVGRHLRVGTAVLFIYERRDPCHKMDKLCQGLRALMENNRQGVLAEVVLSGTVHVGDPVEIVPAVHMSAIQSHS